jgi:hypothetical protein
LISTIITRVFPYRNKEGEEGGGATGFSQLPLELLMDDDDDDDDDITYTTKEIECNTFFS